MNSLKLNIILIAGIALASSCSVYRTGQTPDDVYYSPNRETSAYVQTDNRNSNRYNAYDDYLPSEDRYLRMMVRNPSRWSVFNDYNYYNPWSYSPYSAFGYSPYSSFYSPFYSPYSHMGLGYINPYGYSYNGFYNSYWSWNSFYNPYYPSGVVYNPKTNPAGYTMVRNFNLNSYTNRNYNNNVNTGKLYYRGLNAPKNTAPNATLGSSVRRVFSGETPKSGQGSSRDSYYSPSNDRPVRTYRPSTYNNNNSSSNTRSNSSGAIGGSGSSGSSSSSSSSSPGSRPSRR